VQASDEAAASSAIIFGSVVAVAQLVESRIVIPVVVGSSPISHPKDQQTKTGTSVPVFVGEVD
jgi:hypothetical protein